MPEQPLLVKPVPALEKLSRYTVGRPDFETDLILDFNESLEPLPISGDAPDVPNAHLYPWTEDLVALLAGRLGISSDRVIVTCGADDALERAVRSVCCPGRRAVMIQPTYGMPRRYAILAGADIVTVPWWSGAFPVDAVCDAAGDDAADDLAALGPAELVGLAQEAEDRVAREEEAHQDDQGEDHLADDDPHAPRRFAVGEYRVEDRHVAERIHD